MFYFEKTFFFGRRWLKKRSGKTEIGRPKRGNDENGGKQGRGQPVAQKKTALSRLVTKRILARLARARQFMAKLWRRMRKMKRKDGNTRAVNFGKCAEVCQHFLRGRILKKGNFLPRMVKKKASMDSKHWKLPEDRAEKKKLFSEDLIPPPLPRYPPPPL